MKKNDLSAFKAGHLGQLAQHGSPSKAGAKPKGTDKRAFKVQLSFTEAEMQKLEAEAGLVPLATYLYDRMRKAGII